MIKDKSEDINWFLEKFSDMVEANENNVTANQKFKLQNFKKL
jgi:hypothetical protein